MPPESPSPSARAAGAAREVAPGRTATEPSAPDAGPAAVSRLGRPRIGQLLLARGLVTRAQLAETLLRQPGTGKRVGALLVESGYVAEKDLLTVLAEHLGLPVVDLRLNRPDPALLVGFPQATAASLGAIPVRRAGRGIEVAVSDPLDRALPVELANVVGTSVELALAPAPEIELSISRSYAALVAGTASPVAAASS